MLEQRLTFVRLTGERSADGHLLAEYACSCGNIAVAMQSRVKNGSTRSCGCLTKDTKPNLRHGHRKSRTYASWQAMLQRCRNSRNKDYPRWGGAGVKVCERWTEFENFLADMGQRPDGKTLDRIDTLGNYEPGNCQWASLSEQQRNRRGSMEWHIKGRFFPTLQEATDHHKVTIQSIRRWVFGSFDDRRNRFTPPAKDCHATPRY